MVSCRSFRSGEVGCLGGAGLTGVLAPLWLFVPRFDLCRGSVHSGVAAEPVGLYRSFPARWCRRSSESWWLGARSAVGGGGFGCSPSTVSSGGGEARIREVRGASPAGVPQRLRSCRWWRVALEVHKARFAMALSRSLGCWIFVLVSSGGRFGGGGGWLRRAVWWPSKRSQKVFVVFSFFLGTFLLVFQVVGLSGQVQRVYACCALCVVPI